MDELIDALEDLIECKAEYRKAAAACTEDVGYYCSHEIERLDRAKAEFKAALDAYIREVMKPTE